MNHYKKFLAVLLVLTLMLSVFSGCGKKAAAPVVTEAAPTEPTAAAAVATEPETAAEQTDSADFYHVGDKVDDFTITTYDGREMTLSKVLEEKDMVLLNFWGTFCDPCAAEFPAMQEAYEQYRDKVEIIALSIAEEDTDEVLAEYVQEKGMTFPVAGETSGVYNRLHCTGVPVSVVVDRFGTICVINPSGCDDPEIFMNVFEIYTAEDYTQSVYMPSLQSEMPDAQPADPAELNAALNAEGGNLVFTNHSNPFYWPMNVEQMDGRTVAFASNGGTYRSEGVVETQVEAKAGDVLVLDYKLLSENHIGSLHMAVDGKEVKNTSLTKDWTTWAYRFAEDGSHRVSVSLVVKDTEPGVERVDHTGLWIDSIRLVSGDEAEQALAKNPVYPVAEELSVVVLNETVEHFQIVAAGFESVISSCFFCTDPVVQMAITLPEGIDPENTYLRDQNGKTISLASYVTADGYLVEIPTDGSAGVDISRTMLMHDGNYLADSGIFTSWEDAEVYKLEYAEHMQWDMELKVLEESWTVTMPEAAGDGTYTVTYVDQNGDPVPGVMCQVCDEVSCRVFVSDESGVCQFELPAGNYEIHTLKVPAGYEGDTTTITQAPANGGELNFTLTKN